MRIAPVTLSVFLTCALVGAQTAKDAAAKKPAGTPAAEARFKELTDKHAQLMKELPRGRTEEATKARSELAQVQVKDLEAFIAEFPKSPEANKARLSVAGVARTNKDLADAGKKALEGFDPKSSDAKTIVQAAGLAAALGLEDKKTPWLDQAVALTTKFEDRLELVTALKNPALKEGERADKLLAELEKGAKSDDDRAAIGMFKATAVRRANREDKDGYKAALADVAKQYGGTKAGKLAQYKLAAAELKVGSDPIPFSGNDQHGKPVSLADYKGKVVLVDFWAIWCGPCVGEIPNIVANYEKYHDKGFDVLGISLDRENEAEKLTNFTKERNMPWRQIYDGKFWSAEVAQMYDVQGIPYAFLVGKDGKIAEMKVRGEPALENAIKKALGIEE